MASFKIAEVTDSHVYVVVTKDDNTSFGQMIPIQHLKDGEVSSVEDIVRDMLGEKRQKPTTEKLRARKDEVIAIEKKL